MAWGSIGNWRLEPPPCAGALEAGHQPQKAGVTTEDTVVTTTDQASEKETSEKAAPQEEKITADE